MSKELATKWSDVTSYGTKHGWQLVYGGYFITNGNITMYDSDGNNRHGCYTNEDCNGICTFNSYQDMVDFMKLVDKDVTNNVLWHE